MNKMSLALWCRCGTPGHPIPCVGGCGYLCQRLHGHDQPLLKDAWGVPFYGRAETTTGDAWWYVDDEGRRHPLLPEAIHPR